MVRHFSGILYSIKSERNYVRKVCSAPPLSLHSNFNNSFTHNNHFRINIILLSLYLATCLSYKPYKNLSNEPNPAHQYTASRSFSPFEQLTINQSHLLSLCPQSSAKENFLSTRIFHRASLYIYQSAIKRPMYALAELMTCQARNGGASSAAQGVRIRVRACKASARIIAY